MRTGDAASLLEHRTFVKGHDSQPSSKALALQNKLPHHKHCVRSKRRPDEQVVFRKLFMGLIQSPLLLAFRQLE